jgi:NAD+ synthase (glutamine-hydrolysing)
METMGFIRLAAAQPRVVVADPVSNAKEMVRLARSAEAAGAAVVSFPELSLCGYTCGDLFFSEQLRSASLEALDLLVAQTRDLRCALVAGLPLRVGNKLYNCAAVLQGGRVTGIVPKMTIPGAGNVDESRWFSPGSALAGRVESVRIAGKDVPFGSLLFSDEAGGFSFGVEIGREGLMPVAPGARSVLAGADAVFNPAAFIHEAGQSAVRGDSVRELSSRCMCAYVRACAGPTESTAEAVYAGHSIIASAGDVLQETVALERESVSILADVDVQYLRAQRLREPGFGPGCDSGLAPSSEAGDACKAHPMRTVMLSGLRLLTEKDRLLVPPSCAPYIPADSEEADELCLDIFDIQSTALAERLVRAHARTAVIGVSGGSDSTLALLVAARAMHLNGKPASDILAVSMPGFGTTARTKENAGRLIAQLGCDAREIPICDAVMQHFKDIGHDPSVADVTYENSQARERTQILMDLANQTGGFVVGTGDLSEMALGWCTFNGDHMSMYSVNAGLPKGLVRRVIGAVAGALSRSGMPGEPSAPTQDALFHVEGDAVDLQETLQSILGTPISPELLPTDSEGNLAQQTEDVVGPYELHDFFLYHAVERQAAPARVLWLAEQAFAGAYSAEEIRTWLAVFIRRFFSQQFKRNSMPDGPKLIALSLSPNGGWRMPSDAVSDAWLGWLK